MPTFAASHSQALLKVCAVCTNLRGEKASKEVSVAQEELIRKHVFAGFLKGYEWFPQGVCTKCAYDLKVLESGRERHLTLPLDYSCTLPRTMRSFPPGPCMCRWCKLARLQGQAFLAWQRSLKEEETEVEYLCTKCGRGVVGGRSRHTCSASDRERVEGMVANLPEDIKGKLALALLREVQEEQGGAGDWAVGLPQPHGGVPTPVYIGSKAAASSSASQAFSHTELQALASKAHLTGTQTKSVVADMRIKLGQSAVEPGLAEEIIRTNKRFQDFFATEVEGFLEKSGEFVMKPLFYCTRTAEFLRLAAELRGKTLDQVQVFIQGDSGQGWFKLAASLIDLEDLKGTDENLKKRRTRGDGIASDATFLSHGVRKIFILALVQGVPENNFNLDLIYR